MTADYFDGRDGLGGGGGGDLQLVRLNTKSIALLI